MISGIIKRRLYGLALCLTSIGLSGQATIQLSVTSTEGERLQEAGIGQPFFLNVVLTDIRNTAQYPLVKVDDQTHIQPNGFQMNIINGATSVTYHYRVRIDTTGSHTLGPVKISEPSGTIESNPITITVSNTQKIDGQSRHTSEVKSFIRLTCDRHKLFVGEKAHCTLTFYTSDPYASLQELHDPDQCATQFECSTKQGPVIGSRIIDGTQYRYAQWDWYLYPKKAGTQILPSYAIDYATQTRKGLFSFFAQNQTKRIYSNTLSFDVSPIPHDSALPFPFIGTVTEFSAKLEPHHAKVGTGITLALTIHGYGNFDRLASFTPEMPETLKMYESKRSVEDEPDGTSRCTIEYIIQGTQPGTFTIPTQTITYFDTNDRAYKKVQSLPVSLQLFANPKQSAKKDTVHPTLTATTHEESLLAPLHEEGPWSPCSAGIIPWHIFWLLILALCLIAVAPPIIMLIGMVYTRITQRTGQKTVYQKIKAIEQNHAYAELYVLFTDAASQIFKEPFSAETAENILRKNGLSESLLHDWHIFFNRLAMLRFGHQESVRESMQDLLSQTTYWIDIFKQMHYHPSRTSKNREKINHL